jgi:predicted PurR-regulated permease PerM
MIKKFKGETKWFYWFTLLVAIVIVYKILDNFTGIGEWVAELIKVIKPFLMAILLAYLLYIPARKIETLYRKNKVLSKKARGLSIATTYILAILIIALLIKVLVPMLSDSIGELASNLPGYYDSAIKYIEELPEDNILKTEAVQNAIKKLQQIDIAKLLDLDNLAMYLEKVIGIANGIFSAFVTIVVSIYILLERAEIVNFVKRLNRSIFTEKKCQAIDRYFEKGNDIFFKYISGQIIDAIVVAIIMSVALTIMKVKYAVLLGFLIGVFNLIPYFGAIIAVIVACVITIFTGGFVQAIWVAVVLIILQQIDANIINPKILRDALEISKILIIFAVTVGGAYFGVLGMFLGVPAIAVIKMMLDDYIERNEKEKVPTNT